MREQNWNIVFGQPLDALRSAWEARPGGVAIAAGPGVELQKAPLVSAQEKALHDTGRYGKGDQVVHVVSPLWARWSRGHHSKFAPCDMLCARRAWKQNRCGARESYQQTRSV